MDIDYILNNRVPNKRVEVQQMKLRALQTEDELFKIINPDIKVGEELTGITSPQGMTLKNTDGEEFVKECMWVKTASSQISFVCPVELIEK